MPWSSKSPSSSSVCWFIRRADSSRLDGCSLLAGEGSGVVIVIIWRCGVSSCVCVYVVSSIERVCLEPVAGSSVCEGSHCSLADVSGKTARVMGAPEEGCLDFVFPSVPEGFCRHLLSIVARRDVRCTLLGSGDCWVWPKICCPNQGTIHDALSPLVWEFSSVVLGFATKSSLRCVSPGCCCIGGCHTHVQRRAASLNSNGGEKISGSGLCFCESSGFRGNPWIRVSLPPKTA